MPCVTGDKLIRQSGLEGVLITDDLYCRLPREADPAAENRALRALAAMLSTSPQQMLHTLMREALPLCNADTSGLSVLHHDGKGNDFFRWDAMAGVLSDKVGGTTPSDWSPCGTTLSMGEPQLFSYPGRTFHYFLDVDPQIVEGLVVPIYYNGLPLGTIWVVTHDDDPARKFTLTEVRTMKGLANFTSAAMSRMGDGARGTDSAGILSTPSLDGSNGLR